MTSGQLRAKVALQKLACVMDGGIPKEAEMKSAKKLVSGVLLLPHIAGEPGVCTTRCSAAEYRRHRNSDRKARRTHRRNV